MSKPLLVTFDLDRNGRHASFLQSPGVGASGVAWEDCTQPATNTFLFFFFFLLHVVLSPVTSSKRLDMSCRTFRGKMSMF